MFPALDHSLQELVGGLRPVSLDDLNERAALQRRVDHKYLLRLEDLAPIVGGLADSHEVLEIDGERVFDYESTYFDTPSLRCFHDHARDRRPRFKVRTRCYVTTGYCHFEVKVKRADGETVKRQVDQDPAARSRLEAAGRRLIDEVLGECGIDPLDGDLEPSLVTAFRRVTVAARGEPERTTFDFGVGLTAPGDGGVELDGACAIAETKTADGRGGWDRAFAGAGFEPLSLSKYRIGIGVLRAPGADDGYAPEVKERFR
jgi:VTC domain